MLIFLGIAAISAVFFLGTLFMGDGGEVDFSDAFSVNGHGSDTVFSVRSFLLFGIGFGATGMLALAYNRSMTTAMLAGAGAGVLTAALGVKLTLLLQQQQGDSTPRAEDLLGCFGTVTIDVPSNGIGQALVTDRAGRSTYRRAQASEPLSAGVNVRIAHVLGDVVVVAAHPPQPQLQPQLQQRIS